MHCSQQVTVPPGRYMLYQDVRMSGSNTELRGAVDSLPVLIAAHPMCFIIEGTGHAVNYLEYQGNRKEGVSGVQLQSEVSHSLHSQSCLQCSASCFAAQAS